jgi:hypothetical protein
LKAVIVRAITAAGVAAGAWLASADRSAFVCAALSP